MSTVPPNIPVPRLTLTALLTAYIAGLVGVRANQDPGKSTPHTTIHIMTACTFLLMAWAFMRRGGRARWPTLLPLAIAQGVGLVMYALVKNTASKTRSVKETSAPYDAFITVLTVAFATGIMLYGIIPSSERWARHVGVIACVLCGLPTAFLVPSLRRVGQASTDVNTVALIRRAARASSSVYFRNAAPDFADAEYVHDPATGARCGIYVDRADPERVAVFVAFAGSDSKVDWVRTNLNVDVAGVGALDSVRRCDGVAGSVHKGVLGAWKSIREPVWKALSNQLLIRGGSGSLIFCGHSLGGAVATVAAMDIACELGPADAKSLSAISFGSPPVGDAAFVRSFASRVPTSIRVTTVADPVPKLVIRDFVHVETEYPVVTSVENPVTAHSMTSYLRALDAPSGTFGASRLAATVGGVLVVLAASSVLALRND